MLPSSFAEALRLVERDEVFRDRRIEHAVDRWLDESEADFCVNESLVFAVVVVSQRGGHGQRYQ